jgi:hypothetical protein
VKHPCVEHAIECPCVKHVFKKSIGKEKIVTIIVSLALEVLNAVSLLAKSITLVRGFNIGMLSVVQHD